MTPSKNSRSKLDQGLSHSHTSLMVSPECQECNKNSAGEISTNVLLMPKAWILVGSSEININPNKTFTYTSDNQALAKNWNRIPVDEANV